MYSTKWRQALIVPKKKQINNKLDSKLSKTQEKQTEVTYTRTKRTEMEDRVQGGSALKLWRVLEVKSFWNEKKSLVRLSPYIRRVQVM